MKRVAMGIFGLVAILTLAATPMITGAMSPEAENVGQVVNSEYSDFAPVVSADGSYLFFTSDRPGGEGGQDIWESHFVNGSWTKPANLGPPVNTEGNEGPDCIVTEGDQMYLYLTLCHGVKEGLCDIYVSELQANGSWSEPEPVGSPINSEFSDANASWDYINQVMYFVSTREGGFQGPGPKKMPGEASFDIWMCPKNPDGSWGKPQNLGTPVNTPNWEGVAFYHAADQTIYFASNGHGGMGGSDVFRARQVSPGLFDNPEPVSMVNTEKNDMYFSIPAAGDFAYFSSNVAGGFGEEDIYVIPVMSVLAEEIAYTPIQPQQPTTVAAVQPQEQPQQQQQQAQPQYQRPVQQQPVYRPAPQPVYQPQPRQETRAIAASHVETIYFNLDSSKLMVSEKEKLKRLSEFLEQNRQVDIEIAGHTDSLGSDDYNVMLSKKRADAVKAQLVEVGIGSSRMTSVYYGENKPAETNDPEMGNPLNRRVEISIK